MTDGSAKDGFLAGVARGGSLNLVGAVCQQACLLLTTALIARVLGQGALGSYTVVYAVLMLLLIMASFGFRAALTRSVAQRLADADGGGLRGTVRFCLLTSLVMAVVAGGLLLLGGRLLADAYADDALVLGFRCAAVALPALTFRELALAATQGWRSQREFTLIGWVAEPLVRLLVTAVVLPVGAGLAGVFVVLAATTWASALAAGWALRRRVRTVTGPRRPAPVRDLLTFSLVSWASTLAFTGLTWADSLLLGWLADTEAVGLYTVATRIVFLAVFVMAPINAAFAPQFAHLFHVGDLEGLRTAYAASTGWILRLSVPAFVALLVVPELILGLFGAAFPQAAMVTIVLSVGQFLNAATGPCGTLLNMCGRVGLNMANNVVVLALNVGLNLWLIPRYGTTGAAVAWSVSLGLVNLARLVEVRWVLGIHPLSGTVTRSVAAGVATAVALLALRPVLPDGVLGLALAALVVAVGYAGATAVLGLTPAERTAVGGLRRRAARG